MRYFILFLSLCFSMVLQAQTVRILTYNIHHANPPSKPNVIDMEAIAKVINEAKTDVVGIQEVDINVSRSEMINQAEKLAEMTGMEYFFSKGINLEKGYYGVLILSKHKIIGKRRYDLPMPVASENRSLAIVDVQLPDGKTISLANTHLDLKEENRIAQATFINELGELYSKPLILVGDLNARPDSKPIKILEEYFVRNTSTNKPTIPVVNPKSEIDYIMVLKNREFEWKSYTTINETYASDHLPLVAEITFK
ncbi:endonuclease/exonuclease/phosphatase family protein [Sphingobacterium sp. PU5-4]|uniref:Endonuclease/exonuclease/phosphatase family protein n=1 Tax=Sphingobacterium tenebrionis TaxID=3111775 RepID=A0ABU8I3N7_9SPHI